MDTCPFVGPLILLFWSSGDVSSGFQSVFQNLHEMKKFTPHQRGSLLLTHTVKVGLPNDWTPLMFSFYFKKICGTHVHLWGHWFSCFGILVTSALGFKVRVAALLALWQIDMWYTLGPAYNEHFGAWKSARCSRVLVVAKLFNIVVSEMVSAQH